MKNSTFSVPFVFNLNRDSKSFYGQFPDSCDLLQDKNKGIDIYSRFLKEAGKRAENAINDNENSSTYVEVHHIVPRHAGGADDKDNKIVLLFNDHVLAHYIRWIQYNETGDKIAYSVMSSESIEARKIKAVIAGSIGGPKVAFVYSSLKGAIARDASFFHIKK
jgi:hypothetical protein